MISLNARSFRSLAALDVESLLLVRQCRFLESTLDSDFTTSVLTSPNSLSFSSIKKDILLLDFILLLNDAAPHLCQPPAKRLALGPGCRARSVWYYLYPSCIETFLPPPSLKRYVPCSNISLMQRYSALSHHSELTASIEEIIDASENLWSIHLACIARLYVEGEARNMRPFGPFDALSVQCPINDRLNFATLFSNSSIKANMWFPITPSGIELVSMSCCLPLVSDTLNE